MVQLLKSELQLRLSRALATLRDAGEPLEQRVHETRRQLKRLRAISALLVGDDNPLSTSDRLGVAAVARSLGRLRDPFAQLGVWREFSRTLEPQLASGVRLLLEEQQANTAARERMRRTVQRSERVLETLHDRVSRHGSSPAGDRLARKAWFCGMRAAYRKARQRLRRARQKSSWKRLHALRRASQFHRYQLHFLQEFVGKPLTPEVKIAARLVDQLGLHHDLGAIERYLATVPGPTSTRARRALRERMQKLATSALRRARRVFSDSPGAFERKIRGYALQRAQSMLALDRPGAVGARKVADPLFLTAQIAGGSCSRS